MTIMPFREYFEKSENVYREILIEGDDCILTFDKYGDEYLQIQIIALNKNGDILIEDEELEIPLILNWDEVDITMRRKL